MKYMTRELFDRMQPRSGVPEDEEAALQWEQRCQAYNERLEEIREQLPAGMRKLAGITLHDGIVRGVRELPGGRIRLEVDATNNPWGPRGMFVLTFSGVRYVEGLDTVLGDWWLYEEVHLHPEAAFDYRVLLQESQLRIVADDVGFTSQAAPRAGGEEVEQ